MSRLAENLIDIFNVVGNDEELLRLLYYPTDPLDEYKANVSDLDDFADIRKERMLRSPKTDELTDKAICRVCMYFGNRGSLNRILSDQDVVFDVYAHIDKYDQNDARSLKIVDRINELLKNETITGIGRMKQDRMLIIGNPPSGYIGYKMIYTFGSGS